MNTIDANKYFLKQICLRYNVDAKEMKKYAAIIWKCESAVRPFTAEGIGKVSCVSDLTEQLNYIKYDRHDLAMVERVASSLAMARILHPLVKETVNEVQSVFQEASDRYLGIYEKFFGFMGDELHRNKVADYSRSQLYVIRYEALVAFGIVFDEMTIPMMMDCCRKNIQDSSNIVCQ